MVLPQLLVAFKQHKLLFMVEGQDSKPCFFSNIPEFNEIVGFENVRPATVKSTQQDLNRDGKPDQLNIKVA